jgi:hypothetical protein
MEMVMARLSKGLITILTKHLQQYRNRDLKAFLGSLITTLKIRTKHLIQWS